MKSLRAFSSHFMQDFRAAGDSANGKYCPGGTAACGRDSLWIQTDLSSSLWKKLSPAGVPRPGPGSDLGAKTHLRNMPCPRQKREFW